MFGDRTTYSELNQMAEEAKRRAEIARYNTHIVFIPWRFSTCQDTKLQTFECFRRLREFQTLKGRVESVVRLKNLDIDTIQQAYTVWVSEYPSLGEMNMIPLYSVQLVVLARALQQKCQMDYKYCI